MNSIDSLQKTIICYCAGGLGNRLMPMAASAVLAHHTGRRLKILWRDDDMRCQVGFNELFSNPVEIISDDAVADLTDCKIYADIKDVYENFYLTRKETLIHLIESWGIYDRNQVSMDDTAQHVIIYHNTFLPDIDKTQCCNFLQQLTPIPQLQARIDQFRQDHSIDRSVIGVHARGTDFHVSVQQYVEKIDTVIKKNSGQRFLVCSDDPAYEQHLTALFPQHVITRPKQDNVRKATDRPTWINNTLTSKTAVHEALVDIYLLALTDFKIFHIGSSFAQMILILNQQSNAITAPEQISVNQQHQQPSDGHDVQRQLWSALPTTSAKPIVESASHLKSQRILYFCPDVTIASAGIRRLHRHVMILNNNGFQAAILYQRTGSSLPDQPEVPRLYLDKFTAQAGDVVVIPEGFPQMMHALRQAPCRRFAIALNWDFIFKTLPNNMDWRIFNIERVIVVSAFIGNLVSWTMHLPFHLIDTSIDPTLYYYNPEVKIRQITYIQRKAHCIDPLQRVLHARNPAFCDQLTWQPLDNLPENEYAAEIRRSALFLNLSSAEGTPTSCLEAMKAGTLVAGFDAVGGRDLLRHNHNCLLAPNNDYVTLAYTLAPLLKDLMAGHIQNWQHLVNQGRETTAGLTPEVEARSLIQFWQSVL